MWGSDVPESQQGRLRKIAVVIALLGSIILAWIVFDMGSMPPLDEVWIRDTVASLGAFGPVALVGLMVLAIVISPIPSGPIAIAAGALYGTTQGAILSGIGAEIGALIAFGAARYLGYDAIRQSQNRVLRFIAVPRSQHMLMAIVFASRLIPFISFDAISYATGLTNLTLGRFALATALGVVPVCWALAAMGAGMSDHGINWLLVVVIGGGITLAPALFAAVREWWKA